ncbi:MULTISPECIES: FecCD family ABC transporter permease [Lactiplantibacillus]|uniref:Iron ABC transporter permease n=1 Tax=Lactiplantibacillus argentoratensis TaxID=271881 RepID=A0ABS5UKC9_9LACO|nr:MULTISPECIES: iron ABC transporter permease [Lactiplantibacillus]GEK63124.1 iron ABC transporter permease [Lactobacillus japonicus]AYC72167.1 iron ABC transporter permease [Lactiplantibacillus plantarum]KTF02270.1 ABC-type Fe3+-siderophore transport system permease 2 component [Lactiplantibacillus plantarum]KZT77365.1 ABC-type Fe3+-siderophore transport system permease 2 component [Lactiplantibacillus plantarum]MBT1139000.1 iron ABC transporter permease [Lactiplantibacillus argentoratensis]
MSPNRRLIIWSLLLTASMLGLAILNLSTGTMTISWPTLLGILTGHGNATDMLVLVNFRLPRIVLAIMVGWALALSGNVLQTVTNNPMADPSLLGINNGAGLTVMLLIIGAGTNASLTLSLPIVALAGAWLSTALIFLLANQRQRGISSKRLLLVGVALSGCFSALMVLMTLKLSPDNYQFVMNWLAGSLWGTDWSYIGWALPWLAVGSGILFIQLPVLDAFTLGTTTAQTLGINLKRQQLGLISVAAMLAGVSVAISGGISFIGLITPNLARRIVGSRQRYQLPLAGLLGSTLLLAADTLGKLITTTTELPAGVLVALIGAPYFIYLLVRG